MNSKINALWASWFSGFIDGEGYFQIAQETPTYFRMALTIDLREDDEQIVREIQSTLNVGQIYHIFKKADRLKGIKSADQFRWTCRRPDEILEAIIPLFDSYPLKTKKSREYKIWRDAAFLIGSSTNAPELERLHRELLAQRKYRLPGS